MTYENVKHNSIRDQITAGLKKKGFDNIPYDFPIDGTNIKCDSDGRHPHDKADTFMVTQEGSGRFKVVHNSYRHSGMSGCFFVQESFCGPSNSQPTYLQRKGIKWLPAGVSVDYRGNTEVPIINSQGEQISHQSLWAQKNRDGRDKSFAKGQARKGGFFICARQDITPSSLQEHQTIYIAEGLATACSVHEATNAPCIVAFDKDHIVAIAMEVAKLAPKAEIILALDSSTIETIEKHQKKYNTSFSCTVPRSETKNYDFNDVHNDSGIAEVVKQLKILMTIEKKCATVQVNLSDYLRDLGLENMDNLYYVATGEAGPYIFDANNGRKYGQCKHDYRRLIDELKQAGRLVNYVDSDYSQPHGTVYTKKGRVALNYTSPVPEYIAPRWKELKRAEYDTAECVAKAKQLHQFIVDVLPQDHNRFLMFLKHLAEQPTKSLHFATIIYGPKGTGKSCLLHLADRIIGRANVGRCNNVAKLFDKFGASTFVNSYLNIAHEFDLRRIVSNSNFDNALKTLITEKEIMREDKHKNVVGTTKAYCNFLWATNCIEQVKAFADERRYEWLTARGTPLPNETYEVIADEILDLSQSHYGEPGGCNWAVIRCFVELFLSPLQYSMNAMKTSAAVRASVHRPLSDDPYLEFWRLIDTTPLDEGRYYLLWDIAVIANTHCDDFKGALFAQNALPQHGGTTELRTLPAYNVFMDRIKRIILSDGRYTTKVARPESGSNFRRPAVMLVGTAGNNANYAKEIRFIDAEE